MKKRKLNVLHLVLSLNPGGLEKVVLDLTKRVDVEEYTMSVCCLDETGNLESKFREIGIDIFVLKRKQDGADWSLPLNLAELVKKRRIDIIHSHNFTPNFYGAISGLLVNKVKVFATQHNRRFFEKLGVRRKMAFKLLCHVNNCTVFVSEDSRNLAIEKTAVSRKKTAVIHNGIDTQKYKPSPKRQALLDSLGIGREFIIGTISRLSKEKDLGTLLLAFRSVLRVKEDIKLIIVGDGPEKNSLIKLCDELELNPAVAITGYRDDISDFHNLFDIFVTTSLTEGISLTLLEAMSTGTPPIATEVGGNVEIIVDQDDGIFVKPKDVNGLAQKILRLINDPLKRKEISQNARRRVIERFSVERMVKDYTNLYQYGKSRRNI